MSLRLVSIHVICLSIIFESNWAYYLSLHALEWKNANNYCQSYCNNDLASVHNLQDHVEILNLADHNPHVYTRVWLGLNDITTPDTWQWSDGSRFDYGAVKDAATGRVARGNFPWRNDEPDYNDSDQCVALEIGEEYQGYNSRKWVDRGSNVNYHFLCNDCSGKVHKYAAVNGGRNFTDAEQTCQDKFGTSLASIHSDLDMIEAVEACKQLTIANGCWLGLNDRSAARQYTWTDNTKWDYGLTFKQYPWYDSEPGRISDQTCIILDPSNGADVGEYLWDDYWCDTGIMKPRALCNAPSEICDPHQFRIHKGNPNDWTWSTKPCGVKKTTMNANSVALLGDKQYLNTAGVLRVTMMYSITSAGLHASAGIALYLDDRQCDSYYYIGIWAEHSVLFIGRTINNKWQLLRHTAITPTYVLNTPYELSFELMGGTEWNVFFNGQFMFAILHNAFNNAANRMSGYIGIRNVNAAIDVKSLYVSGDVQYEDNNVWYNQCTEIATNPTPPPTRKPTHKPTRNPTSKPSNPTDNPLIPADNPLNQADNASLLTSANITTLNPSLDPTIDYETSNNQTVEPKYNKPVIEIPIAMISLSNYSSVKYTQNPTLKPSLKPSLNPSVSMQSQQTLPTKSPSNMSELFEDLIANIEDVSATKASNRLIWIVLIPIGLILLCFGGGCLLYEMRWKNDPTSTFSRTDL